MKTLFKKKISVPKKEEELKENIDYYWEGSYMVLTGHYLKKRGYCCKNACRHCPWDYKDNE